MFQSVKKSITRFSIIQVRKSCFSYRLLYLFLLFFGVMKNVTEQKRLTVKQAATKIGVSVPRVHQLIQEGRLPAEKLGRDWIIETSDLEKLKLRPTGRPKKEPAK